MLFLNVKHQYFRRWAALSRAGRISAPALNSVSRPIPASTSFSPQRDRLLVLDGNSAGVVPCCCVDISSSPFLILPAPAVRILAYAPALSIGYLRLFPGHSIQFLQHLGDFLIRHEGLPHQPGPVVLDHHDNWRLVQSHVQRRNPILARVEGVPRTIDAPQLPAQISIVM